MWIQECSYFGLLMKRLLVLAAIGVLMIVSKAEAKPSKNASKITGKQYIVLNAGAKALSDNSIFYIPCIDASCDKINQEVINNFFEYATVYKEFNKKLSDAHLKARDCIDYINVDKNKYLRCSEEAEKSRESLMGNIPMSQDEYLRNALGKLTASSKQVNTDFDGNYSFVCPTTKCFIFSIGKVGKVTGYWLKILNANSKFNMTNSTLFYDTDD